MIRVIDSDLLASVIPSLVGACAIAGRPTVPEGRRDDLQRVLSSALIGPAALEEYLAVLLPALAGGGLAEPEGTLDALPVAELVAAGLPTLADAQLALVAVCPGLCRAVNALVSRALCDGEAGRYWEDAELLPDEAFPPDYLPESRAAELAARFKAIESAGSGEG
jgi:hypothetical protein